MYSELQARSLAPEAFRAATRADERGADSTAFASARRTVVKGAPVGRQEAASDPCNCSRPGSSRAAASRAPAPAFAFEYAYRVRI